MFRRRQRSLILFEEANSSTMSTVSLTGISTVVFLILLLGCVGSGDSKDAVCQLGDSTVIKSCRRNLQKRSLLTYPKDSAFQMTMGISLAGMLERNSAGIVLAFQQNAKLPINPESFFFPQVVSARQFSIYSYLKDVVSSYGFNGMECLKKMVCQIAESPVNDGLLEEVITFVLSPSKHRSISEKQASNTTLSEEIISLLQSESLGKIGGNCTDAYPQCNRTPLDMISQFIHL